MQSPSTTLIADIGGTNARFAFTGDDDVPFHSAQTFQCADYDNVIPAIDDYLASHQITKIEAICFAVAGPIVNELVTFTNNSWSISCADLRDHYGTEKVQLINDFESISFSLPSLTAEGVRAINGDWDFKQPDNFNYGVLGPGSGLGVGGIIRNGDNLSPIVTEGGHIGFAADNEMQLRVLDILQTKFDRVSNERLLSGPGLINIHEALCQLANIENPGLSATDIAMGGTQGGDKICEQTMQMFFEILGQVAGDIALALGAVDGMFIAGGIVQRYPEHLINSKFRSSFEHKGRYKSYMQNIPTWLITYQNPGLRGCSYYARNSRDAFNSKIDL